MKEHTCDIAIIGAGIVGIATAYYILKHKPTLRVVLVDFGQPMALTSAQSGENYRNWWPHPIMTAFTDQSISLMEEIDIESGNRINMKRRGYVLATRSKDVDKLSSELISGYAELENNEIRVHKRGSASNYQAPASKDWASAPSGVDVINDQTLIKSCFPYYDTSIQNLVHIRRAGDIDSQQLGQYMFECFRQSGGERISGEVYEIENSNGYHIRCENHTSSIHTDRVINAAGPFINKIARMLNSTLPVFNTLQQKISFEDRLCAISRTMPFSIDLDDQLIAWNVEDRELIKADSDLNWLTSTMPGSIHCRPDGGEHGNRVKLGWAYNVKKTSPILAPELHSVFPEVVLRGAARLNPSLEPYTHQLPGNMIHYGGYYTMTEENWPLIGPMRPTDSFVVGAMSGFGTMAACAAGDLCARWLTDAPLPSYAEALSPQRYCNTQLMSEIRSLSSRGVL